MRYLLQFLHSSHLPLQQVAQSLSLQHSGHFDPAACNEPTATRATAMAVRMDFIIDSFFDFFSLVSVRKNRTRREVKPSLVVGEWGALRSVLRLLRRWMASKRPENQGREVELLRNRRLAEHWQLRQGRFGNRTRPWARARIDQRSSNSRSCRADGEWWVTGQPSERRETPPRRGLRLREP